MLILFDNAVLFVSYFCRANLNTIKTSLIREALALLSLISGHSLDSLLVLINDDIVVKQVSPLYNAITELNDQLQAFHDLWELTQVFVFDRLRDIHRVHLEFLELLQDLKNLILLRSDLEVVCAASNT